MHLLLVIALVLPSGEPFLRSRRLGPVVLRGLFLLGSTVLNFLALGSLPLTMTTAIMFTGPLWVCMLSIPLLGETRRAAPLDRDRCRLRRHPRRDAALVGDAALGGGAVVRRGALRRRSTRSSPAGSPGGDSTATQQFYAGLVATLGMAPFALQRLDLAERRGELGAPSRASAASAGAGTSS